MNNNSDFLKIKIYDLMYRVNNFLNPKELLISIKKYLEFKKFIYKKNNVNNFLIKSKVKNKSSFIFCYGDFKSILIVSFFIIALRILGYKVIGILHSYNFIIQHIYKYFGVNEFIYIHSAYNSKKKD